MCRINTFFLLLLLATLIIVGIGNVPICCANRQLSLTNITHDFNSDFFRNVSIELTNSKFNVHMDIIKTIERALLELIVLLKLSNHDDYTNFVNTRIDLCTFLRNPLATEPFLAFLRSSVMQNKQNHIVQNCPIKPVMMKYLKSCLIIIFFLSKQNKNKKDTFDIKDFEIDTDRLPLPVPSVQFSVGLRMKLFKPNPMKAFSFRIEGKLIDIRKRPPRYKKKTL